MLYVGGVEGGSNFAENGNWPIFMADGGHKNSAGNENIILEGRKTEIFNIIVTDIAKHRSYVIGSLT